MNKAKPTEVVLGLSITQARIEAVLVRPAGDETFAVVGRFTRQRATKGQLVGASNLTTVIPGLQGNDESDFTIQVGDGGSGSGSSLFLAGEFTKLGAPVTADATGTTAPAQAVPFVQQLAEILGECRRLGYPHPRLAFCIGAPDVSYIELFVSSEALSTANRKWNRRAKSTEEDATASVDRRLLMELLSAQHRGSYDAARVTFLPMTRLKSQQRYLALVPEPTEPVAATLDAALTQHRHLAPTAQTLDTEISLYITLARRALTPASNENTALVRVGSDDTLVMFLEGTHLRHVERLRSLTTYDPPETICSRVLLQQDEQKIGAIHHVLYFSDVRAEQFDEAFRKLYPRAEVQPMQATLQSCKLEWPEQTDTEVRASTVPAAGVALKALAHWPIHDPASTVNLLPKKLRRKPRPSLAFAWHTFAMLGVLFAVTLFFTMRYVQQEAVIEQSRAELRLNPPDPAMASPAVVRARVDSLKRVYQQYNRALYVLDSLLVGSDQWSRTLEKTARATRDLDGVWFEAWQPNGNYLRLSGNARTQRRVAQLAYRLDGEIEAFNTEDVNDVRIHPFTIVVPRPIGVPRIAEYLQDAVTLRLNQPDPGARLSADSLPPATSRADAGQTPRM